MWGKSGTAHLEGQSGKAISAWLEETWIVTCRKKPSFLRALDFPGVALTLKKRCNKEVSSSSFKLYLCFASHTQFTERVSLSLFKWWTYWLSVFHTDSMKNWLTLVIHKAVAVDMFAQPVSPLESRGWPYLQVDSSCDHFVESANKSGNLFIPQKNILIFHSQHHS